MIRKGPKDASGRRTRDRHNVTPHYGTGLREFPLRVSAPMRREPRAGKFHTRDLGASINPLRGCNFPIVTALQRGFCACIAGLADCAWQDLSISGDRLA